MKSIKFIKCTLLISVFIVLFIFVFQGNSQTRTPIRSSDELMPEGIFSKVPEDIRHSKPYLRHRWFYEQRAYPYDYIPEDAYKNSLEQRDELRRIVQGDAIPEVNWANIGPTPGYYFNYGNISSRIVTGAYHPTNPNIIYVGPANGGIWKSTDSGTTWSAMSDYESSLSMGAIVLDPINPEIIYAGTGEATYSAVSYYGRGLLKSTNGGATWTNYTSGLPSSTYFSRLKIRPNNNTQLLAALGNSGLYRSTNSGVNWTQIISGRVDDVVFSPSGDTAFAVGSGIGIRRSINGGASFSTYGAAGLATGTRTHFDLAQSNPSIMWATVYGSSAVTVFKSTDYGFNWNSVTMPAGFSDQAGQAWYDLYCLINPKNPNKVYIGMIDIFRTENGSTFTNITNGYSGGNVHVDQHYLIFHPSLENTIISCNDGGIWRSTNNGTSFTNLNQNLTLTQFYRIAASPFTPNRILGGTQDNGTQQTNSSTSWAAVYGGDGGEVCFNPFNSNFILGETQYNGIFRTTNGGTSWSSSTSGLSSTENKAWVAPIIHHPSISGTFYTARQSIYKSTNNGGTWTAVSGSVNGTNAIRELAQSKTNPNVMFVTSGSQVFKSSDEGINWINVTSGLPARTITSVYVHPQDVNQVFLTFSGFNTNKVYKSTNGGSSWASIQGNLPNTPVNDILIFTENQGFPNTYFIATDIGVFVTENNGVNWFEIPNGLPNTVIMHLDYSPSVKMLRAGTHGRGVYQADIQFKEPVELTSFKALIEGYFDGINMRPDSVTVELRNTSSPYTKVDEATIQLDSNGNGTGKFYIAENATPYYLVIRHRNALETWSALPQSFSANTLSYDFTTSSNKAYGNNLKMINGKWCIYGGDVNRDGYIETADVNLVYSANVNGVSGGAVTDLNGDLFTEIYDLNIVFINKILVIQRKAPPGYIFNLNR